jgi:hypothetical protein
MVFFMKYLILFVIISCSCYPAVYKVGAGGPYTNPSQVAGLVKDGDTVDIASGVYSTDVAIWRANNLLLRGIGGFAHLKSGGSYAEGKGIWVIKGKNTTVENIEFSEAKVPDKNGAGIRQEGDNLTVRHCYFHHCENGILTGASATSDIVIMNSEFAYNGFGDGYSHNMYIGNVRSFTIKFCYTHHSVIGHNIKSRANNNYIYYNRIMDEMDGTSSMNIDLPNGGASYIIGNLIMQGPLSENSAMITYGLEGLKNADSRLYVVNNTFVNKRSKSRYVVIQDGTLESKVINNIFAGNEAETNMVIGSATLLANLQKNNIDDIKFIDEANYDYGITWYSPALDAGVDPGSSSDGNPLFPFAQYKHPMDSVPRIFHESMDAGAYEYIEPDGIDESKKLSANMKLIINGTAYNSGVPEGTEIQSIKIFDYSGNQVYFTNETITNTESIIKYKLPVGVFLVILHTQNADYYLKLNAG